MSELVATPTSPIPAARPSGAIVKDGMDGETGLVANIGNAHTVIVKIEKRIFFIVVNCLFKLVNILV
jgi:hypothetical protein